MLYQIDVSRRAHQDIEDAACYIAYPPPRVGGEFFVLLFFSLIKFLSLSSIFSSIGAVLLARGRILCYPMRNFTG